MTCNFNFTTPFANWFHHLQDAMPVSFDQNCKIKEKISFGLKHFVYVLLSSLFFCDKLLMFTYKTLRCHPLMHGVKFG